MNDTTAVSSGPSTDVETILGRLGELAEELDRLCHTLQAEPQVDRTVADRRTAPGRHSPQPEPGAASEIVATIEIVDARSNAGNSPASERIVSAVLPRLLTGVTEVRVTCTIQYERSQAWGRRRKVVPGEEVTSPLRGAPGDREPGQTGRFPARSNVSP